MIVCKRGVLNVYLADDTHADFLFLCAFDLGKVRKNFAVQLFRFAVAAFSEKLRDLSLPFFEDGFAVPLVQLIGAAGVIETHHKVAVQHRVKHLQEHSRGDLKAAVLFKTAEIQGQHGNLRKLLVQSFAEQMYII